MRWLVAARALVSKLPRRCELLPQRAGRPAHARGLPGAGIRGTEGSLTAVVVYGIGLLALVALVMRARVLAARRAGVRLRQRGWLPALLVGAVSAFVGIPWTPLPIAEPAAPTPAVHRTGPLVAATTGLALLALTALLEIVPWGACSAWPRS